MCLAAISFTDVLVYALFASVVWFGYRLTLVLAKGTERLLTFLVRAGLSTFVQGLLLLVLDYDVTRFTKPQFFYWNQLRFRIRLFWGCALLSLLVLFLMEQARVIGSCVIALVLAIALYIGARGIWLIVQDKERERDVA